MNDDQTTRAGDEKRNATVLLRMARQKEQLIEQLRKIPIVQIACEKVGVSRATYYNWKKDDTEFASMVDAAILDGTDFVNDMAESQLLSAIKEGSLPAITYWLKHRHAAYGNRLEVTTKSKPDAEPLSTEQEEAVRHALQLAAFTPPAEPSDFISFPRNSDEPEQS